mgnify:CR=1 FL=1
MHALGPAAVGQVLDDAAGHGAGDAQRVDELARVELQRRADAGGRRHRAEHGGGMKARLVHRLRHHQAQAADGLDADGDAEQRTPRRCSRSCSAAASTAGTMTAPACTGPPSKVSSKSSPCAAVPLTKAARGGAAAVRVADDRGRAGVRQRGERGRARSPSRARAHAQPDDVDQQPLAGVADCRWQAARHRGRRRAAPHPRQPIVLCQCLRSLSCCEVRAPKPGTDLVSWRAEDAAVAMPDGQRSGLSQFGTGRARPASPPASNLKYFVYRALMSSACFSTAAASSFISLISRERLAAGLVLHQRVERAQAADVDHQLLALGREHEASAAAARRSLGASFRTPDGPMMIGVPSVG